MKTLLTGSLIIAASATQVFASENCADYVGSWKCSTGETSGIITITKSEKQTRTEKYKVDDGILPYKAECTQKDGTVQLVSPTLFSVQTVMEIKNSDTITVSAYLDDSLLMSQECDRVKD